MLVPAFIIRLCPTHIAPFFYSRYSAVKNSIYIWILLITQALAPLFVCGFSFRLLVVLRHVRITRFALELLFSFDFFYKQLHSRAHVDACALICTHVLHTHCIY
uniref:Expressed protein n=1 Tax=Echinococcus granulosus TaxID=6210 RepID=A0A068WJJ7_ECHGR|nr:expressed protein [Echinococcus granulosus]